MRDWFSDVLFVGQVSSASLLHCVHTSQQLCAYHHAELNDLNEATLQPNIEAGS